MGIEVEEFGIGFPPRAIKLFTWKGTDFTLNWIPLGGSIRSRAKTTRMYRWHGSCQPWKRIPVLLAGVAMNLLTAVLVYTILFSQMGIPDTHSAVVAAVEPGSPAATAGLMVNDVV